VCSYTQFRTNSETELPSGEERSIFLKKKLPPHDIQAKKRKKKLTQKFPVGVNGLSCANNVAPTKKKNADRRRAPPPIVTTYGEPSHSNYIRGQAPKQGHHQPQEKTQQTPKRTKSKGNIPRNTVREKKIRGAKKITAYKNAQKPVGLFRLV